MKIALAAAALMLAAAAPAQADPKHCPPGHAKKGWCGDGGSAGRAYEQGYRDGREDERRYGRGDRLPRERYVIVEDYDRYGYPRPRSGQVYARVDERIFLIAAGTGLILEALR